MQIAQARQKAQKLAQRKMMTSPVKRPDPNARVYLRDGATLVEAPSPEELVEKLAKRIQRQHKSALH